MAKVIILGCKPILLCVKDRNFNDFGPFNDPVGIEVKLFLSKRSSCNVVKNSLHFN